MRRSALLRCAVLLSLLFPLAACDDGAGTGSRPTIVGAGPIGSGAASVPRLGDLSSAPAGAGGTIVPFGASPYSGINQLGGIVSPAAAPAAQVRPGTLESSPTGDELAFVTALLTDMQLRSYATGRETCGYVGRDAQGRMMATDISLGDEASCYLPQIPPGMRLLASVHTHGTYSPRYASEFPTVQDMMTDAQDGIDGYISTPGGRLWHVDTDVMTVSQLCGRGCLPQDPNYRPEDDGPLRPAFTIRELQAWEAY